MRIWKGVGGEVRKGNDFLLNMLLAARLVSKSPLVRGREKRIDKLVWLVQSRAHAPVFQHLRPVQSARSLHAAARASA